MFLGQYTTQVKSQQRLSLREGFQDLLTQGAYVTRGFEQNLLVLPTDAFRALYRHITSLNIADPLARLFLRMFLANAGFVSAANDGLVELPEALIQFAEIESEAVVVGLGDYFEIWSPAHWARQQDQLKDHEANAQKFSSLNLSIAKIQTKEE